MEGRVFGSAEGLPDLSDLDALDGRRAFRILPGGGEYLDGAGVSFLDNTAIPGPTAEYRVRAVARRGLQSSLSAGVFVTP